MEKRSSIELFNKLMKKLFNTPVRSKLDVTMEVNVLEMCHIETLFSIFADLTVDLNGNQMHFNGEEKKLYRRALVGYHISFPTSTVNHHHTQKKSKKNM